MPETQLCPDCQSAVEPSLGGLCPVCLLRQGLEIDTEGPAPERGIWDPPASKDLAALFPDLDVLELIGRGGMGAVYKARQHHLERIVAVKVLPPEIGTDNAFASRFAREAQAMARLNHPNIVAIHDFGQTGGICFFVMEYVDGATLRQLLAKGPLAPATALPLVMQICAALQYAHSQGIVHRDIKPDNILVAHDGQVKIADFGLAKLRLGGSEPVLEQKFLQATGKAFGTPHYMAPEQFSAPKTVDHRADIYSLGVVIYQMLTGELPQEAKSILLSQKNPAVDPGLDPIVSRAMERDPDRRYQSMSEIRTEFAALLDIGKPGDEPDPRRLRMETLLRPVSLQTRLNIAGFFLLLFAIFMLVSLVLPAISGTLVTWFLATGLFAIPALLWGTLPYRVLGGLAVLLAATLAIHDYRDGISEHNQMARQKQDYSDTADAIAKAFLPTPTTPDAWFIIAREGVQDAQRVQELIGKENLTSFLLTINKDSPVVQGGYEWEWPANSAKAADRPLQLIGRLNQYHRILNPEDLRDLRYETTGDIRTGHFRVDTEYELKATFVFSLRKTADGGWFPTSLGVAKKGHVDADGALMIIGD